MSITLYICSIIVPLLPLIVQAALVFVDEYGMSAVGRRIISFVPNGFIAFFALGSVALLATLIFASSPSETTIYFFVSALMGLLSSVMAKVMEVLGL